MNEKSIIIFTPENPEAAARFFRECTRLKGEGLDIHVGIPESPFRPGLRSGVPTAGGHRDDPSKEGTRWYHDVKDLVRALAGLSGRAPCSVFISHERMRNIHEISSSDLLAVVDGGVRLGDLIAAVNSAGLYFPHESGFLPDDLTVAEMIMGGAIVSTEGRFGRLRETVLSVELVTPAGESIHQGSRSVKDVGGYEVIGFLMGAGGRCGMVSRVTLRLLPRPQCSAFFAGRGDPETLKTLAHHIHKSCSPVFLEIFEREAARLLVDRWEELMEEKGRSLPAFLQNESGGECLLVGELEGLESVVEQQLLHLVSADATGEASLVLIRPALLEELRRFPLIPGTAFCQGDVLHLSFDAVQPRIAMPDAAVYRSLYPERNHLYIANAGIRFSAPGTMDGFSELVDSKPRLLNLLENLTRTDLRVRVELVSWRNNEPVRLRITLRDFLNALCAVGECSPSMYDDYVQRTGVQEKLVKRILAVFDPMGIMLP